MKKIIMMKRKRRRKRDHRICFEEKPRTGGGLGSDGF
jgi:hypothetical protein